MTDNYAHGDGTISVRDSAGVFHPVETPDGFTDYAFRNIVAAVDTYYRQFGKLPNATEAQKFWPKTTTKIIASAMMTEEFRTALAYRGVDWEVDSGLSLQQSMALLKLTDWTDARSTNVKLKELGIPMARFQAWMKQPLFAEAYRARTEGALGDAVPLALNKLMGNVEKGDQRAIEKVLEITGRWNPAQQSIEDLKLFVIRIMEAVVRREPDSAIRRAILDDIKGITAQVVEIPIRAIEE